MLIGPKLLEINSVQKLVFLIGLLLVKNGQKSVKMIGKLYFFKNGQNQFSPKLYIFNCGSKVAKHRSKSWFIVHAFSSKMAKINCPKIYIFNWVSKVAKYQSKSWVIVHGFGQN